MTYQFSFEPVFTNWLPLLQGAGITLLLTFLGSLVGVATGILGAVSRGWKLPLLQHIFSVYVESIRNTPFLVQLYFIFFGLPALGIKLSGWEASFIAMALNLGAYSTEIIRSGILAIPSGQIEAAKALALSKYQTFRFIVLKPALKTVWPALCSQIIIVMLGSSVCSQVAAMELTYSANLLQSMTFRAFEIYLCSTIMYLILAILIRKFLHFIGDTFIDRRPA